MASVVSEAHRSAARMKTTKSFPPLYNVGDVVKHLWKADGKFYLCKIKAIKDGEHGRYKCLLHYHGWSTSEDLWVADTELDHRDWLQRAAKNGHVEVVKHLLDSGYEVNEIGDSALGCQGALHWAAHHGHMDLIKFLLTQKADVNLRDGFRGTPIHMAAREGNASAVQLIMNAKADLHAQDDCNSTALHYAAEQGHSDTVSTLLQHPELQLNLQDADGDTPLHLAAHGVNVIRGRQHVQVVEQLVQHGASIYIERKNGRRAFELTKNKGIRALLEPKSSGTTSVTPARRNADLFELPPPPDLVQRKRLRHQVTEEPNAQSTDGKKDQHSEAKKPQSEVIKTQSDGKKARRIEVKSNAQVDVEWFSMPIDDGAMYRHKPTNNILSGRFLRVWLIQKGKNNESSNPQQWEKTGLALWEPGETPARRTMRTSRTYLP